jgi:hypothetical protein
MVHRNTRVPPRCKMYLLSTCCRRMYNSFPRCLPEAERTVLPHLAQDRDGTLSQIGEPWPPVSGATFPSLLRPSLRGALLGNLNDQLKRPEAPEGEMGAGKCHLVICLSGFQWHLSGTGFSEHKTCDIPIAVASAACVQPQWELRTLEPGTQNASSKTGREGQEEESEP